MPARRQLFLGDFLYPGELYAFLPGASRSAYLATTTRLIGDDRDLVGHHVRRQALGEEHAQRSLVRGRSGGAERGLRAQHFAELRILEGDDGGALHRRVRVERGLDLARLDAVAADLHHAIDATAEVEEAVVFALDAIARGERAAAEHGRAA